MEGINIIDLKTPKVSFAFLKIIGVINRISPDIILSTQFHCATLLLAKTFYLVIQV